MRDNDDEMWDNGMRSEQWDERWQETTRDDNNGTRDDGTGKNGIGDN